MKTIIVSNTNKTITIDDEDYERLKDFIYSDNGNGYLRRCLYGSRSRKSDIANDVLRTKDYLIDHKDGDGYNNLRSNLRIANKSLNASNTDKHKDSKSPYKGVFYNKRDRKWQAKICKDYNQIHIGYFFTAEEAAIAYNKKALELFGEFARLNII